MMKSVSRFFLGTVLIGLFLLPETAHATLQLQLTLTVSGSSFNGPATTYSSPQSNLSYGGFNIGNLSYSSNEATGTLSITSFTVTNTGTYGAGTLTMTLSDSGMINPSTYGLFVTSNADVATTAGTVTFQSFAGSGLNSMSFQSPLLTFSPTSGFAQPQSASAGGFSPGAVGAIYSLTDVSTFTLASGTTDQFYYASTTVSTPEPATLAMIFTGLPMVGLMAWRKRRTARV